MITLNKFAQVSNLIVNESKSVILPLGKNKENRGFPTVLQKFKVVQQEAADYLGVPVTSFNNKDNLKQFYMGITEKFYRQIRDKHDLSQSLLHRTLNVKSLLASVLVYPFSMLQSPHPSWIHSMQSFFNKYIWSNGKHNLNKHLIIHPLEKGGLNAHSVDIQEKSLKFIWIKELLTGQPEFWKEQVKNCFTVPIEWVFKANMAVRDIHRVLKPHTVLPPFWRGIVESWCKYRFTKVRPCNIDHIPVYLNSVFTTKKVFSPVLMNNLVQLGIEYMPDLLERSHLYMPIGWTVESPQGPVFKDLYHVVSNPAIKTKAIYSAILDGITVPTNTAMVRWEQDLQVTNVRDAWPNIVSKRKDILNVNLRSFYIKYINRFFKTNFHLRLWNVRSDDLCSFCKQAPETRLHLYWECHLPQVLWQNVIEFCKKFVSDECSYTRENCLLYGFDIPVLNLLSTLCKHTIHIARLFGRPCSFQAFLRKVEWCKNTEKIVFARTSEFMGLHWCNYKKYWGKLIGDEAFQT